jgi:tetratricopeptide (TPR) repeat protein
MKGFSTAAGPTDPRPAFFDYCSSLIGGEEDLARAARYYRLALRLVPDFAEALYALALLKRRGGATTEAIALFEAAADAQPHPNAVSHAHITANSWRNLAEMRLEYGKNELAEACFRKALDHLGIHGVYHAKIAAFMRARGHLAEAARQYELLMPYSHVYPSQFSEPNYPLEETLPFGANGRPCDPLTPTSIRESADGGRLAYWWHLYLPIPQGVPFNAASLIKMKPQARPIAGTPAP